MKKRLIALILCIAALLTVLAGCAGSIDADSEYKGQQITMYLSENVYNLDPAYAYTNESSRSIVNLLFDTLFKLDKNGKVQPSIAKSYRTEKTKDGEYFMYIEINEGARWSDNQPVTADDVVYAWKRLLNPNNAFNSAYLLFDIKGARDYNKAEISKDDIGLTADGKLLTIEFEKGEGEPDYNQFLLNLTSLALAPLREDIASKNEDWAKKPGIMTASGPFKLSKIGFYQNGEITYEDINYSVKLVDENNKVVVDKNGNPVYEDATSPDFFAEQRVNSFVLERNAYYYRNAEDDEKLDVSVTPYRILVDCSLTDEEIIEGYKNGIITYVGDIPVSIRNDETVKNNVVISDSLSTSVLYLNQKAEITRLMPKEEITTDTQTEESTSEAETCDGTHKTVSVGFDGHCEMACEICNTPAGELQPHNYDDSFTCTVCGYVRPTESVKLFENTQVRQALSLAINREEIAKALVYAKVATGIVPDGIFDTNSIKSFFRDNADTVSEFLSYDLPSAKAMLQSIDINGKKLNPSEYYFGITVSSYDDEHMEIAKILEKAWGSEGLGFNVKINVRGTVANNDYHKDVASVPSDLCDDLWAEDIRNGSYEVAVLDLVATSADSMSILAPFARQFAGEKMDMSDPNNYVLSPHSTGYDSEAYNELMEKIYANRNSDDLHKAEDMLMNDMPVIPLVFNQSAYLINEDVLDLNNKVLFWETAGEYYYPVCFDKISVKDYDEYELECAKYVYNNFDEWKTRSNSYFCTNFENLSKESFAYTNSNYYYLFKDKYGTENYDWIPAKPEK